MKEEIKKGNRLIDLVKDSLDDEEKRLVSLLNFEENDEVIIQDLIKANILNFGNSINDDKENR